MQLELEISFFNSFIYIWLLECHEILAFDLVEMENQMKTINDYLIKDIIEDKIKTNTSGLTLIDAPTGIGKTYQAIKFIQENYQDKKIIFVANQEKLLPDDELFKGLTKLKKQKFKHSILKLPSLLTSFKKAFKNDANIKYQTIKLKYKVLYEQMFQLLSILNSKSNQDMSDEFGAKSFYDLEKEFRKSVVKEIKSGSSERDLQAYRELYPAMDIFDKSVILMTTKKFFSKIDPLIKTSFYLSNNPFSETTIIIFDEIDSVKNEMLDIIISNAKRYPVDIFGLFKRLNEEIRHERFISEFPICDSEHNYALKYKEDIIKYFDQKTKKYIVINNNDSFQPLDYFFKSYDINNQRNFIFDNGERMMITGNKKTSHKRRYLRSEFVPSLKINYVKLDYYNSNEYNPKFNLEYMYKNILECINYFVDRTLTLSNKYRKSYNQSISGHQTTPLLDFENALSSILDKLNLGYNYTNYIKDKVYRKLSFFHQDKVKAPSELLKVDKRRHSHIFYKNGFSYLELVDSDSHSFESKFYLYDYDLTPEGLLVSLAQKFNVIGLSATATISSNIINFDLDFFKYILNEKFYVLSKEELEILNQSEQNIQNNVSIDVIDNFYYGNTSFGEKELYRMYLQSILNDEQLVSRHVDKADKIDKLYALKTCADLYYTIKLFLKNDLHSLIFFTNNNIKNWGELYKLIKETSESLLGESGYFKVLTSELFKNEGLWKKTKTEFAKKDKVVLVSAYQTVSLGMNLQYEDYLLSTVKDIDCVFLQKPTQIIPLIMNDSDDEALVNYIYAMEYSRNNDTINAKQADRYIKEAFRIVLLGHDNQIKYKYNTNTDIVLGMAKQLIQALGRIKRVKEPTTPRSIKIYTTNEVVELLGIGYRYLVNENSISEFKELLKFSFSRFKAQIIKHYKEIDDVIKYTNTYIDSFIKNWNWTCESRLKWRKIREFVLRFPTFDESDLTEEILIEFKEIIADIKNIYFYFAEEIDQYSFGNKHKDIKRVCNGLAINRIYISQDDAGLSSVNKHNLIKQSLKENNVETEWKKKHFILSKDLYKRIYKGALGEIVGQIILEQSGLKIFELNQKNNFEQFDFKVSDNIMIDFKNWSNRYESDLKLNLKKINNKANKLNVDVVYIINVFKDSEQLYETKHFVVNDIHVYTIPWLFDLSKKVINKEKITELALEVQRWKYKQIDSTL